MINELINILSYLNNTSLNWFIFLADGTIKGVMILTIILLLIKFRNRLRPQTNYLILFLTILSLLVIPLLTQAIAMIYDNHFHVQENIPNSLILNQAIYQKPTPVIRITPQIPNETGLINHLPHWSVWLFLIWNIGVIMMLGKLIIENIRAYHLSRNAELIMNHDWFAILRELKAEVSLDLPVTLKFQSTVPIPVVLGCFNPVILIPESADTWSAEQRRIVLLHELAHIKRFDNLRQNIANLIAIVYWFNPLVWILLHLLKTNRELACDDQVLETGVLPSTYATHLLAFIHSLQSTNFKLKTAAAMGATNIKQRMVNILTKRNESRRPLKKYKFSGLILIAVLIVALCSITNLIGLATANDHTTAFIENPQISMRGEQMELIIQGKVLTGTVFEFPTLWPEKGVRNKINGLFGMRFHPILKEYKNHSGD